MEKEKINVAEILRNCQSGMELDCTMYNKVTLLNVDDGKNRIFPIKVLREDGKIMTLTKYGQYTNEDFAKCVIFPKGKITWKGFVPKFKVDDVIQDKDSYKVRITDVRVEDEMYEYESVIAKGIGGIGFDEQDQWELVPDKFDINTLVPFESKVLVRSTKTGIWRPAIWGCYASAPDCYNVLGGICWLYCIPYEGNEHLIGKTDDCDEYFKTWSK